MRVEYREGLLFVSISVTYKEKTKVIDNIVIDTGAAHSIISSDVVGDLGIVFTQGDPVVISYGVGGRQYAFVKKVDRVAFGGFSISDYSIDFGLIDPDNKINGLLGLDLLMQAGAILDLKKLRLAFNEG
ncbi:retropepsin-like aspartic protease [Neomoorella thermoacetica]|uniref:retropepsin-like aspartic protease n=1 Tax=Neomoorella thermoacetica TaxID=1525 RepID=UPI000471904D|nr:retropepsin-like aspartic protease [Moorella thermoacetica]